MPRSIFCRTPAWHRHGRLSPGLRLEPQASGWSREASGWSREAGGWSREASGWSREASGWSREASG